MSPAQQGDSWAISGIPSERFQHSRRGSHRSPLAPPTPSLPGRDTGWGRAVDDSAKLSAREGHSARRQEDGQAELQWPRSAKLSTQDYADRARRETSAPETRWARAPVPEATRGQARMEAAVVLLVSPGSSKPHKRSRGHNHNVSYRLSGNSRSHASLCPPSTSSPRSFPKFRK